MSKVEATAAPNSSKSSPPEQASRSRWGSLAVPALFFAFLLGTVLRRPQSLRYLISKTVEDAYLCYSDLFIVQQRAMDERKQAHVPATAMYCTKTFPDIWSKFITTWTQTMHAKTVYDRTSSVASSSTYSTTSTTTECSEPAVPTPPYHPTFLPAAEKVVAIGDIHGDIEKAKRAFRLANLVDESGSKWIGGSTVAVQVGDILDRGDNEVQLFYWFEHIKRQAEKAGGALHMLLGNHETMNVAAQFRYATPGGVDDFRRWAWAHAAGSAMRSMCDTKACADQSVKTAKLYMTASKMKDARARFEGLKPGGDFSRQFLADKPVILVLGSTVFVHGGLLPHHAQYGIERINKETQDWLSGKRGGIQDKPAFLSGREAVVWARDYSHENEEYCDCAALRETLSKIPGAKRMVVGHTIQQHGINSVCDDMVYRVDVGLSKGCGDGTPEVLVIHEDGKRVERVSEDVQVEKPMATGQQPQPVPMMHS